jgi:ankyrin repeat protein
MVLIIAILLISTSAVVLAGAMEDLLFNAIGNNDKQMLKTALDNGADINCHKFHGIHYLGTPLDWAIQCADTFNGTPGLVPLLIENGADVNIESQNVSYSITPLIKAIQFPTTNVSIVRTLLNAGADVNIPLKRDERHDLVNLGELGNTPLMVAVTSGNLQDNKSLQIVRLLLEKNANVNQANDNGIVPLMQISRINVWTLDMASPTLRVTIAKMLLEAGADPSAVDNKGKTALQYAIENNQPELIKLLLPISPK